MTERSVLGVDLASSAWSNNGSARLSFDLGGRAWTGLRVPALAWPGARLTAAAMARTIDEHATGTGIAAVALDGPQGWRAPDTEPGTPGVGRRCEWLCKTQGKTGVPGKTYPQTQRDWIEFSIDVFEELLVLGHARLAAAAGELSPVAERYWLLECYPTWTWRESGLVALPGLWLWRVTGE
jgi:hypothetical protein